MARSLAVIDARLAYGLAAAAGVGAALLYASRAGAAPPAYAGIDLDGARIPRAGTTNATLRGTLPATGGLEPYGQVVAYEGVPWVAGTTSWFGGPRDTGVTATERGAISGEVLRSLALPDHADRATIASRPQDFYFAAMRFDYSPKPRAWWRDQRLVVANPQTGARVVVRPADWGPNTFTRRIIDTSEQTLLDLGLRTDQTVLVAFAPPGTPLGPVR